MIPPTEGNDFNIEITPDLLLGLRADLSEVFDLPLLDAAHKKKVQSAGDKEYSWVYRPEIPLLVQAFNDCDSWVAALAKTQPLPNLGALGPFVRLGMAIRFGRSLRGGIERLEELKRLAAAGRFKQMLDKTFEFEVAYNFGGPGVRDDLEFGSLGGNPDIWLGDPRAGLPVECKVVSGNKRPSIRCLGVWRRFVVAAVKEMERNRVCAGISVRARDDFGPESATLLQQLATELIKKLSSAPDETWTISPDATGTFFVYGYRLCEWGKSRPPFAVDLGLDGDVAVWVTYDPAQNEVKKAYFLALKFQAPELIASAAVRNFEVAAGQIKKVHPEGPGLVVLKLNAPRAGDLFEIDRAIQRALSRRPHVSAVLLMWDESHMQDDGHSPTVLWGFTLRSYLIVNNQARVRIAGWDDSKASFFPHEPRSMLRSPSGELLPFDAEAEQRILDAGTTMTDGNQAGPVLFRGKPENMPPFPHIIPETPGLTASEGQSTLLWRFAAPLAEGLFHLPDEEVLLEWLLLGTTQIRIYKDRHCNIRIHRRSAGFQDNVAIDLIPFGRATDICLQLAWTPGGLSARVECLDGWPPVLCRAVRSPLN